VAPDVAASGTISRRKNPALGLVRRREYSDVYCWTLSGWNAAALIRQLLPYLHVKRSKADEMLLYYPTLPDPRLFSWAQVHSIRDAYLGKTDLGDTSSLDDPKALDEVHAARTS